MGLLSRSFGWGIEKMLWPLLELNLRIFYWLMKASFPRISTPVFSTPRKMGRKVLIAGSEVMNHRPLLDRIVSLASRLIVHIMEAKHGSQMKEDVELFFQLGLQPDEHKPGMQKGGKRGKGTQIKGELGNRKYSKGKREGKDGKSLCFKSVLGSGDLAKTENCFFPIDLKLGPDTDSSSWPPMSNSRNRKIAKTCAFLSVLSYRDDKTIRRCMIEAEPRMLPNTSLFSVHSKGETDIFAFVADDRSWAIFCFRGTEFETLRDWLTSALLNPTVPFVVKDDPRRVRDRYFEQMRHACCNMTGKWVVPPNILLSDCKTVIELAQRLPTRCKVYCTGHSLGAGEATLLGAFLAELYHRCPAAIVSFGSPPVGNQAFCGWFERMLEENRSVSWRFVNGVEFAPMAPPLPFTSTPPRYPQELVHVKGFIPATNILDPNPENLALKPEEMEKCMDELAQESTLSKIIADHNPVLILRAIEQAEKYF